jgi:hypothetical protein
MSRLRDIVIDVADHHLREPEFGMNCRCGARPWSPEHVAEELADAVDALRSDGIDLAVLDELLAVAGTWCDALEDRIASRRARGDIPYPRRALFHAVADDLGHGHNLLRRLRHELHDLASHPDHVATGTTAATSHDVAPKEATT